MYILLDKYLLDDSIRLEIHLVINHLLKWLDSFSNHHSAKDGLWPKWMKLSASIKLSQFNKMTFLLTLYNGYNKTINWTIKHNNTTQAQHKLKSILVQIELCLCTIQIWASLILWCKLNLFNIDWYVNKLSLKYGNHKRRERASTWRYLLSGCLIPNWKCALSFYASLLCESKWLILKKGWENMKWYQFSF